MRLKSFRIKNYKSWSDSQEIVLGNGLNVIVGQNNSGKTAMLEAMSLNFEGRPHLTIISKPEKDSFVDSYSVASMTFEFEEQELFKATLGINQQFFIPFESSGALHGGALPNVILEKLNARQTLGVEVANGHIGKCLFEKEWYPANDHYIQCAVSREAREIVFSGGGAIGSGVANSTLPKLLMDRLRSRIYFMKAERFNVASYPISNSQDLLHQNSGNLAQVLHHLHSSNRTRFTRLVKLLTKVFPTIKDLTVPVSGTETTIMVWLLDPEEERLDLAIPLSQSGTGIGQVLAMLYLIVNSETPQCILIDEPQSFLHPGAMRALLEIFSINTQHQYIITTHSPHILSLNFVSVLHITYDGTQSYARVLNSEKAGDARLMLQDVGFKMSDVFGADNILWVEGPTEEECFKLIVQKRFHEPLWGIEIVGVRSTGDIEGRNSELAFDIYQKLSTSVGIIPPAIAYIFDREMRASHRMDDLARKGKGRVHFLARHMYENYLLIHTEAITKLLTDILGDKKIEVCEIDAWIKENGANVKYVKNNEIVGSDRWFKEVHGAKLLKDLFSAMSDNTVNYDKIKHGYHLTRIILDLNPSAFLEVEHLIKSACNV